MRGIGVAAMALLLVACDVQRTPSLAVISKPAARKCSGVCGRVVDGRGNPVRNFHVALFSADAPPAFTRQFALPAGFPPMPGTLIGTEDFQSPDGWFDVDPHGAARVVVGISAAGFRIQQTAPFEPDPGRRVDVTLLASNKIEVRVVDERRRPLAGVDVFHDSPTRSMADALRSSAEVRPLARTNAEGTASVDAPYTPTLSLLITDDRHVPVQMTIAAEAASAEVVMQEGVSLRGIARDTSGAGVAAAAVEARCAGSPVFQTLARSDGTFAFDRLPRARCEILAARDLLDDRHGLMLDAIRGSASVDLRQGGGPVEVVIPPSGRLTGRLAGLDRIAEGYVAFARRGEEVVRLPVGTDGHFSMRLRPGNWDVHGAFDEDVTHLETSYASVLVANGTESHVDLPFDNRTAIRITFNGQPASNELLLEPRDSAIATRARVRTGKPGVWEISGLHRGAYTAHISHGNWDIAADVEVPSDRTIDIPFHTAELYVRDAGGHPINADVRITRNVPAVVGVSIALSGDSSVTLGVAGDGRHVAWEVPSGSYAVSIRAAGYKEATAAFTLPGPVPHAVLQTIDRPFPRPKNPSLLPASDLTVLSPVIADLDARAKELRRMRGERRGRLVVADETIRRPSLAMLWVSRDDDAQSSRLAKLKARPLFRAFERDRSVHALSKGAFRDVLVVSFGSLQLRPPGEWNAAMTEADLFDPGAMEQRWDKASGFVLLSSPEISPDRTEALAAATLYSGESPTTRVYWLVARGGRWRIEASWDIESGTC